MTQRPSWAPCPGSQAEQGRTASCASSSFAGRVRVGCTGQGQQWPWLISLTPCGLGHCGQW